jgi:DNA-binding FadR family transcriptional regulator
VIALRDPKGGLRLHQSIARDVGTRILSGAIAPGDKLGGEIEASEQMGVSRTAYREAIRILIAKGLLESRPKAGTHVLPRKRWNLLDPDMLAWMFAKGPDEEFLRDLFELRGIIEPEAAALAAARRSDEQLAAMSEALEGMRSHGLATVAGQTADQEFHSAIIEACGNAAMTTLTGSIGAAVRWTTHFKAAASPNPRNSLPQHEAVYVAIAASDVEGARRAMCQLLNLSERDMAQGLSA